MQLFLRRLNINYAPHMVHIFFLFACDPTYTLGCEKKASFYLPLCGRYGKYLPKCLSLKVKDRDVLAPQIHCLPEKLFSIQPDFSKPHVC